MSRSVEIHGHRGARGLFPENTIEGFRGTLGLGVDALELDVGMTADGVVVVTHDPALNPDITRGPDGRWLRERGPLIRDLRATDLALFDVGRIRPDSAHAARFPEQRARDGARIPTLASVLRIDPTVRFSIELKTFPAHPGWTVDAAALADAVLREIGDVGAGGRALVEAFDWRGPRRVRRICPGAPVAWLTSADTVGEATLWWGGPHPSDFGGSVPRAVAAKGGGTWGPDHADLTEALVVEAHAFGLRVVPWTVNEPGDIARLIGWGVDGVVTDRPDLARLVLERLGLPVPSPRGAAPEAGAGGRGQPHGTLRKLAAAQARDMKA